MTRCHCHDQIRSFVDTLASLQMPRQVATRSLAHGRSQKLPPNLSSVTSLFPFSRLFLSSRLFCPSYVGVCVCGSIFALSQQKICCSSEVVVVAVSLSGRVWQKVTSLALPLSVEILCAFSNSHLLLPPAFFFSLCYYFWGPKRGKNAIGVRPRCKKSFYFCAREVVWQAFARIVNIN